MHYTKYILLAALFVFGVLPVAAAAQTYYASTTVPYDSGTTPTQRYYVGQWRQSSDLQQKIAALGDVAVQSLPMPALFGVAPSDLTPNFGDPRTNHPHQGEDIMAVKGTPIVSPTAAVVLRLEQGATEGNGIYTANPGGETFVYYHLDRYGEGVVAGTVLQPGSLIGYVGNTGDASGGAAHIHFEIHNSSGTPIDPFPRLTGEFSMQQKISFLSTILTQTSDSVALSQFLVTNFRSTFLAALAANITIPLPVVEAIASAPPVSNPPAGGGVLPAGDLDIGSSGAAVVALQTYLIQAASGAAATRLAGAGATGYFGTITKAALAEYQAAEGIVPLNGYYGDTTRAFIAAHPLGTASSPATVRDMYYGTSGQDVLALQKFLNAHGFTVAQIGAGSPGNETIYFGPATRTAVIKFQLAHNISPAVGYVGSLTRAAIAAATP